MCTLAGILISFIVAMDLTSLILSAYLWGLRHSFDIAARAPVLLVVASLTALLMANAILLHWILLLEGRGLPCVAMYWPSYLWFAAAVTPYTLRAVRLLVAYNANCRHKFARFVKWKVLLKAWMAIGGAIGVAAVATFTNATERYSRDKYGCFFLNETTTLGVVLVVTGPLYCVILFKLTQVNDAFKIRRELLCVFSMTIASGVAYFLIVLLVQIGRLPDSGRVHFTAEMILLVVMLNVLLWSTIVPVAMHNRWRGFSTAARILPGADEYSTASVGESEGVLEYAYRGGAVAAMFGRFCRQNLCMESWDFILEAVGYEELTDLSQQFDVFRRILDEYLRHTSPQEVNICSAMVAHMATFQERKTFANLSNEERRNILQKPLLEIVLMLEQNLLTKFKDSPPMRQWRADLERQAQELKEASLAVKGDSDMKELMEIASFPNGNTATSLTDGGLRVEGIRAKCWQDK